MQSGTIETLQSTPERKLHTNLCPENKLTQVMSQFLGHYLHSKPGKAPPRFPLYQPKQGGEHTHAHTQTFWLSYQF